jgi:hypothetical protein
VSGDAAILVDGGDANELVGNRVGLSLSSAARPNAGDGIRIQNSGSGGGASNNMVGGDLPADENIISNNGGDAISVKGVASGNNRIDRNRGTNNGTTANHLFIDLGPDGPGNDNGPNAGVTPPPINEVTATSASGDGPVGAVIRVYKKDTASPGELGDLLGQDVADGSGDWQVTFPAQPQGTRITANFTNIFGNSSELAAPRVFDTIVPDTAVAGPSGTTTDTTPTYTLSSNEPSVTFECRVDAAAFAPCAASVTVGPLAVGAHTFEARAVDEAGNRDPSPATSSLTVEAPPVGPVDPGPDAAAIRQALRADLTTVLAALKKARIEGLLKRGRATAKGMDALLGGTLSATGTAQTKAAKRVKVISGRKAFAGAGKASLRLKLTKAGRKLLRKRTKQKLAVKLSFKPAAGATVSSPVSVTGKTTVKRKR